MGTPEGLEEVSVKCQRVGYARVRHDGRIEAHQQRERDARRGDYKADRSKRRSENVGANMLGGRHLRGGEDILDRGTHEDIEDGDREYRTDQNPRDISLGIADFTG